MGSDPNKPNFSNVQSGAQTTAPVPPKADFSNVQSGVTSTAPAEPPAPATYTVAKGDSLSKIAKKVLGNANRWREIFDANRDQLDNPDLIQPGQVLKLPADKA
ncbi:LysM peptidoglycan-binding domain-containing protein [Dokdonella sp.]|uniref:LysM peptidoglycan-binding domain-containing protein n=1 Tax=Dokdonella sp. TaxID=2291710 RepID=UPI001B07CD88|nr:LysM peptidoglycan-binding domain-containing protein [Dokdonella sp.]MBO9661731.1 LysM peptidoglycan-binding domain-containing protein [Dokdonella sp.]